MSAEQILKINLKSNVSCRSQLSTFTLFRLQLPQSIYSETLSKKKVMKWIWELFMFSENEIENWFSMESFYGCIALKIRKSSTAEKLFFYFLASFNLLYYLIACYLRFTAVQHFCIEDCFYCRFLFHESIQLKTE